MLHFYEGISFFTGVFIIYFALIMTFITLIIYSINAVASIILVILTFIFTSFSFILLGNEYLGLIYIIVYVGAIAVLFLFVLMLLNIRDLNDSVADYRLFYSWFFFCLTIFFVELGKFYFGLSPYYLMSMNTLDIFNMDILEVYLTVYNRVTFFSQAIFNLYFWYLIFCALILLVVMFGVVSLILSMNPVSYTKTRFSVDMQNKLLTRYEQSTANVKLKNDL